MTLKKIIGTAIVPIIASAYLIGCGSDPAVKTPVPTAQNTQPANNSATKYEVSQAALRDKTPGSYPEDSILVYQLKTEDGSSAELTTILEYTGIPNPEIGGGYVQAVITGKCGNCEQTDSKGLWTNTNSGSDISCLLAHTSGDSSYKESIVRKLQESDLIAQIYTASLNASSCGIATPEQQLAAQDLAKYINVKGSTGPATVSPPKEIIKSILDLPHYQPR